MDIPFEPIIFGVKLNIHLILEYAAFFVGFRYYIHLKKYTQDPITNNNRLSIIVGAVFGAFLGSRVVAFLENPIFSYKAEYFLLILNAKTIMGGLFGGLFGVEATKKLINETKSSGDLFTFPIILGIIVGRIGCFLAGVNEFTYGIETTSFLGMDLGDGIMRYPIALFEVVFLMILWVFLKHIQKKKILKNGLLFQYFMISYFSFRFIIEFLKPNTFLIFGLSSIQYLCILCWLYYHKTIRNLFYAN
ncbi:prolipoprotein diacylglyceryl transferase family protein [Aquimarina gracilis]|uniref:Prolipoprotein diacylglyceryl transferase family protein n=1 Tax=Aquimarina gracilis TaxID=874422 RepID=A0ABU5ZRG3_9FLAO|nr:prolipoprotein diacylglyceryl transferase family protein [Aquimarina gracilis]MEB3344655.1 prolipoprotein diacylglyceryl transferase family protein [Aquimarina gracilis]